MSNSAEAGRRARGWRAWMTVAATWRRLPSNQRNAFHKQDKDVNNGGNAEAGAHSHRSGGLLRHVRRHGRRKACRVRGSERDHRRTGRTRASQPASPQRPKLQPNQDLRRRRGRNRRLPLHREEHLAALSPVLHHSQPWHYRSVASSPTMREPAASLRAWRSSSLRGHSGECLGRGCWDTSAAQFLAIVADQTALPLRSRLAESGGGRLGTSSRRRSRWWCCRARETDRGSLPAVPARARGA
jgi:hypothetical protein